MFQLSVFKTPIYRFYIVYVLLSGFSVLNAINISEALFEWLKLISIFVFFLLATVHIQQSKNSILLIAKSIIVFSLLIGLRGYYEIFTITSEQAFDHQTSYFIRAFSSNRNLYAQILFLCLPINLYGAITFKRLWRIAAFTGSLLLFILILVLLTRSVWLATMFSIASSFSVFVLFHKLFGLTSRTFKKLMYSVILAIFISVITIFIFSAFGNIEVFGKQWLWVQNYKFGSSLERLDLWKKTIDMGLDHWFIGVGQGNWRIVMPHYGLGNLRSSEGITFFQRPHNDFLWVFSENGIFALVFYLLIFLSGIFYLLKTIKISACKQAKFLALALLFGLAGYIIISLLSFPKERIEHQVFIHFYLAISVVLNYNLKPQKEEIKTKLFLVFLFFLFLLMVTSTFFSFKKAKSERHLMKVYTAREASDWQTVIKEIERASISLTTIDVYGTPLEWYKGEALFSKNEKEDALGSFIKAYKYNPNHLHVLNNLATCLELNGNSETAKKYYQEAIFISPKFEESLLNLSAIYYNQNLIDSAYLYFSQIPDTTSGTRFIRFKKAILWKLFDTILKNEGDRLLSKSIERIRNDYNWMQKVHSQSIAKQLDIKNCIYEEVIYLLEEVDSTITPEIATAYRLKFNVN